MPWIGVRWQRQPESCSRLRQVQASDIVLMHDGPLRHNRPDKTVRVLPVLLALLARHGPAAAALPGTATMSE